ncbi:synaptic vesicle 2-related protein-like [Haliotis rubra]|uniref:synaptic vesicle 2-related protein-like n=1 Tax=Haliotis rubra TaxID=36100 RepID=UPI001EE5BC31|nr:synaptic vesicle 2-related protein-like [Haliotis rubra]
MSAPGSGWQWEKVIHLDEALSQIKFGLFHIKMLILAGGGYFAVCSEILVFVFLSEPVKKEWNLSHYDFAWLPFFSGVCGIVGGYVFGVLSDRIGRQIPFIASISVCCVFGVASAFAPSYILLVVLRSLVSVGTGGLESVDFVLLLEFLPKRNRGSYMVFITFCGALGAVAAGGIAWLILPRFGWRWFVGACAVPSIIVFILRFIVRSESPRYLMISGQKEKAMKVLQNIAAQNKTELPEGEIICPVSTSRGRIQDLLSPELRRRTLFMSLIWFFQSTGYWGVTIYLPEYMHSLGVNSYMNMFTIFIGELPGIALAMIVIERHMLGRINSLKFFSFFTGASLLLFSFIPIQSIKAALVIVCYFFMVPIYSILNAFTPEIYPTDVRSTAMAWANIIIEIPGLITPFVGAVLLSSDMVWLYPVTWTACFLLQFIFSFFVGVETAGEELNDKRDCGKERGSVNVSSTV